MRHKRSVSKKEIPRAVVADPLNPERNLDYFIGVEGGHFYIFILPDDMGPEEIAAREEYDDYFVISSSVFLKLFDLTTDQIEEMWNAPAWELFEDFFDDLCGGVFKFAQRQGGKYVRDKRKVGSNDRGRGCRKT